MQLNLVGFTFLSKPFYKVILWIENIVGNWGWAIILFTLLVKLILFPSFIQRYDVYAKA